MAIEIFTQKDWHKNVPGFFNELSIVAHVKLHV